MVQTRLRRSEELRNRLAESGCRITPQRLAIVDALLNGPGHPTAEEIHAHVLRVSPTTSLATVYKTLDTLKDLGEVQELELGSGRHHFDALDPHAHPHVVCTSCGKIEDAYVDSESSLAARAETATGFRIHSERVEFFGLCPSCQAEATDK